MCFTTSRGRPSSRDDRQVTFAAQEKRIRIVNPSYIAGLVDGEGCLSLIKAEAGLIRIRPYFRIEMRSKTVIEKLASHYNMPMRHSKTTDSYRVSLYGAKLIAALHEILPFLIEKKSQAMCILKFYAYLKQRQPEANPLLDLEIAERLMNRCKVHKTLYQVY